MGKESAVNWIKAKEIIPESPNGNESPEVLISVIDRVEGCADVYKGFYEDGEWWTQWIHGCKKISEVETARNIEVVAWMPLPKAYKEG